VSIFLQIQAIFLLLFPAQEQPSDFLFESMDVLLVHIVPRALVVVIFVEDGAARTYPIVRGAV
jgi:hypothetical protein